ncbi:MAG: type IV toxin-antitoxin system AbiEi family antitoxin domain-containing protein [candidate division Zixibacteria bacterium]|nr:type IV toxin-antitoxin system AbiEi family antitoxin domain-containing protein [candidate division Zixibacteria bacterium]
MAAEVAYYRKETAIPTGNLINFIAVICHLGHITSMKFDELLYIIADEPMFDTGMLLSGSVDPSHIRRQLSRWVKAGKLYQLRRGLYAPAPPYRKTAPHPFLIANRLVRGSYVSLQSALAFAHLIPEYVPTVTSVTTDRPGVRDTPLGRFEYRHIRRAWLFGYQAMDIGEGRQAFVATLEKALMDLIYLEPGGDRLDFLRALRLQHMNRLDPERLEAIADRLHKPKLHRARQCIGSLMAEETEGFETL